MSGTREQVLQVARRLFGERGYGAVTIREIAAEAGVSAALVMKVGGSKEQLHADATPLEPVPLEPDVPFGDMGELLVRRMLTRREEEVAEPWLRALYLVADAPDPTAARADFRARFLARFDEAADRNPGGAHRVDLLACLMVGLAAGTRTFRLLPPDATDLDRVVREYGRFAQDLIDGIVGPAT
ncbi:TetR/AcrR family transcriptional regulator [Ornithinicoccus hortensis]|uniref:TetR/AcrR family transcriptional regulator n=1 Tax=Ornithinicoccus hortensis TaxID=82346 RepID=UPI001478FEBD|nr:TetR/AcrR family transcriptional regulator [Ornithinicoccus hortensis]